MTATRPAFSQIPICTALALWVLVPALLRGGAQEEARAPQRFEMAVVEGNKTTAGDVILREIPFAFPAVLGEADLTLIQNRVQNLHLFNRVEVRTEERENGRVLIIVVTESWHIFPAPMLSLADRDWHKMSYGIQLMDSNFRGRAEKLRLGGTLGYNPSYTLNYSVPWIGERLRLTLGIGLFQRLTQNRLFDFQEDRRGFSLSLGKRFSLQLETSFQFALSRLRLPAAYAPQSASGTGTDLVPVLSWQTRWDRRDLSEYPRRGTYLAVNVERSGLAKGQPDFWRATFDGRAYAPLAGPFAVAFRQLLVLTSGTMPVYDRVFLGYNERIRGYYNLVLPDPSRFAGYGRYDISLTSLEVRFPLLSVRYFSLENGPLIPSFFRNLKFGLSAGLFVDSGIVWRNAGEWNPRNRYTGYGVGLHILLPYINVLRLEYALNNRGRGEFIVGAGISF